MPRKKKNEESTNIEEYENKFNTLKELYKNECKEISEINIQFSLKDKEREEILTQIRSLQNKYFDNIDYKLLLDVNSINDFTVNDSNIKNKTIKSSLINSSSSNSIDKIVIKKPLRSTDAETDDDDSVNISDNSSNSDD